MIGCFMVKIRSKYFEVGIAHVVYMITSIFLALICASVNYATSLPLQYKSNSNYLSSHVSSLTHLEPLNHTFTPPYPNPHLHFHPHSLTKSTHAHSLTLNRQQPYAITHTRSFPSFFCWYILLRRCYRCIAHKE